VIPAKKTVIKKKHFLILVISSTILYFSIRYRDIRCCVSIYWKFFGFHCSTINTPIYLWIAVSIYWRFFGFHFSTDLWIAAPSIFRSFFTSLCFVLKWIICHLLSTIIVVGCATSFATRHVDCVNLSMSTTVLRRRHHFLCTRVWGVHVHRIYQSPWATNCVHPC
jgi:hypothetical protein